MIAKMTQVDRNNILNALEETKEQLPEQIYKLAIESLAKFLPEEIECKEYIISFIVNNLEANIPSETRWLCQGDDCCGWNKISIRPRMVFQKFKLHPLVVEHIQEEIERRSKSENPSNAPLDILHNGRIMSPFWGKWFFSKFLEKKEKKDYVQIYIKQWLQVSHFMKALIEGGSQKIQQRGCEEDECDKCGVGSPNNVFLLLENSVILYNITLSVEEVE